MRTFLGHSQGYSPENIPWTFSRIFPQEHFPRTFSRIFLQEHSLDILKDIPLRTFLGHSPGYSPPRTFAEHFPAHNNNLPLSQLRQTTQPHNSMSCSTAAIEVRMRPVCNKGITQFYMPPTHGPYFCLYSQSQSNRPSVLIAQTHEGMTRLS